MPEPEINPDLAALAAAVDEAEPAFVVPCDERAFVWFEVVHAAAHALGITEEIHEATGYLCGQLHEAMGSVDHLELAHVCEVMLGAVKQWLHDHGVPRLETIFSSTMLDGQLVTIVLNPADTRGH